MSNQTSPVPPEGCTCASFWTVRHAHKEDCPLYVPPQSDESERLQEFHSLALKCKKFLEDHEIEQPTDTMAGHMAIFVQKERDELLENHSLDADSPSPETRSIDDELEAILDKVLTVQYNLVTTNDLKKSLAYEFHRYAQKMVLTELKTAQQKVLSLTIGGSRGVEASVDILAERISGMEKERRVNNV